MARAKTDLAIVAIVGFAGLAPSLICAAQGGALALANKEALVAGGTHLMQLAEQNGTQILPVDSEHNAIFQLLQGQGDEQQVDKIILTASGGPFRDMALEDMRDVTPAQAVAHPNWDMGAKISVDSATMMNKGWGLLKGALLLPLPISLMRSFIRNRLCMAWLILPMAVCWPKKPALICACHWLIVWPIRTALMPVLPLDLALWDGWICRRQSRAISVFGVNRSGNAGWRRHRSAMRPMRLQ